MLPPVAQPNNPASEDHSVSATQPHHPTESAFIRCCSSDSPWLLLATPCDRTAIQILHSLQLFGIRATRCTDGAEAFDLACFSATPPAAVLMSPRMPNMDGIEASRLIRQFHKSRGRPSPQFIAVYDPSVSAHRSLARKMRGNARLFLPCSPGEIRHALSCVLPSVTHSA